MLIMLLRVVSVCFVLSYFALFRFSLRSVVLFGFALSYAALRYFLLHCAVLCCIIFLRVAVLWSIALRLDCTVLFRFVLGLFGVAGP
jgi:hypothetical protein